MPQGTQKGRVSKNKGLHCWESPQKGVTVNWWLFWNSPSFWRLPSIDHRSIKAHGPFGIRFLAKPGHPSRIRSIVSLPTGSYAVGIRISLNPKPQKWEVLGRDAAGRSSPCLVVSCSSLHMKELEQFPKNEGTPM